MAYTMSFLTRAVPRQFKSVRYYLRGWPARGPESWKELPRDLSGGMLPRNERNGLSYISRSSRNSRTSSRNVINGETVTPRHALGRVSVKYLCHRIREAVKDADTSMLSNICEVDESYIGGKAKKYPQSKTRENEESHAWQYL